MKTTHLIATVAILAAAGSAFADGTGNYESYTNFASPNHAVSNLTRAQVLGEFEQARAEGLLNYGEFVYFAQPDIGARGPAGARPSVSAKTRAQVLAELEQARAEGLLDRKEYVGQ